MSCACVATTETQEPTNHGVVSAATPEAAAAGAEILEAGGNAIDAAVAVSLALAVTEPAGSGLGGQAIVLIHPPDAPAVVVNGTSVSPRGVPDDVTADDIEGRRAATVPSLLRTLDAAWRKFGSGRLSWADLVAPALRYADEGFDPGPFRHGSLELYASAIRANPDAASVFLLPDGQVPPVGRRWHQPALAKTLRRIATAGADDFYSGEIAAEIARDMGSHGGWITLDDLRTFPPPEIVPALHGTYRGWDVYTTLPPGGGWVVIQTLNIMEQLEPGADDRRRTIWLAEALRTGHTSRVEAPVGDLENAGESIEQQTSKEHARLLTRELPSPGSGETTHFVVVDADGLTVSASQSLNSYFGARAMCPSLGILYNDYMREFQTDAPGHPFALRASAMPYSSMSATILARDGRARFAVGSPGSRRIISSIVQVIGRWVDQDQDIEDAVAAPRIHVVPEGNQLLFERRPRDRELVRELERRGFHLSVPVSSLFEGELDPYFGGVHAVAWEEELGWRGAADPRRDGEVRYVRPTEPLAR